MIKVTLYIPCYNAERFIRKSLDSIINQSYQIHEILIINDGSTDKTVDIIKNYPVRVITHKENKGLAASRNTAFKEAKNEFVASLDADCIAYPQWLEELMKCFVSDDVAGVGGKLIERHTLSIADKWRSVHMAQHWGNEFIKCPPFLYGNNTVFKKKCVEITGFYNEKFITNYEDIDLSMRIYNSGFRLVYTPKAQVEHLRRDTIRSVLNTYWHWKYYKHMNPDYIIKASQRMIARLRSIAEYDGIFKDFFTQDLRERNYKLLPVDLICVFYCLWLDLKDITKEFF